jgi:hypothetical protein
MAWLRRLTVMVLGAILVVDALTEGRFELVPFVVGLIMLGLIPIDAIIDAAMGGGKADADMEKRLQQVLDDKDDH